MASKRGKDPKVCNRCKAPKPRTAFYPNGRGVTSMCRPCHNDYAKNRAKLQPEIANARSRRSKMKTMYGITLEKYDDMLQAQGGVCAICASDDPKGMGRFPVDHCHDTGKVRGLLCTLCNQALGMFRDSEDTLLAAIAYLRRTNR